MAPGPRGHNMVLGALAALAVVASGYAVWSVNRPHPSLDDPGRAVEAPVAATTLPDPPDEDARTTGEPAAADAPAVTEEPDQAEATSPPPEDRPPALTPQTWWDELADGEATLLALGDDHSHLRSQWLHRWGELVGEERPVQIHHWGEEQDRSFNPADVLGEGEDGALTIWSASRAGATIAETVERFPEFDRLSPEPDALLITLGSASGDEDVAAELDRLLDELHPVPVLLVIAPGGLYSPEVGQALADWGSAHEEQVAMVDLRESEPSDPSSDEWAQAFQDRLSAADR